MSKKLLALLALCAALALAAPAWAQSLGNPITLTPKGEFSVGLSVSYLFEQEAKDFDLTGNDSAGNYSTAYAGKLENDQVYLLELAYGVTDWLNVFAQAGVVHGGKLIETCRVAPMEWEAKMQDQFVWGLGAKGQVFKCDNGLALGLAARYLRYDNRKLENWFENVSGSGAEPEWSTSQEMDYWQVDVTAVASMPLGPLTPYVGVGYSHWEASESDKWVSNVYPGEYANYDAELKSQQDFLALVGVELALGHGLAAYVQADFFAHSSLGLGLSWSF